jgi:hypothetical protein
MQWSLNGTPQGNATNSGGNWTFPWTIGNAQTGAGSETLDGNYTIGVIPFDSSGNAGPPRSVTITLARRQPYAPVHFVGGHNGSIVEFQWSPNKEGDITGYQVYRIVGAGQPDVMVCSTSNARSVGCQDTSPPNSASIQYYVRALDGDNSTQSPDPSTTLTVSTSNAAPNVPTGLQASTSNGNTVLLWAAANPLDSEATPDSIAFYRIYRDGQAVANRYDTAPGTTTPPANVSYTDTATGGVSHTYRVTAVDPQLAESPALGPITR